MPRFVDQAVADSKEPEVHPGGQVDVVVFSATSRCDEEGYEPFKSGRHGFVLGLNIEGDGEEYAPVFENVLFPTPEEREEQEKNFNGEMHDEKLAANCRRFNLETRRVCELFGVDPSGYDPEEDFPGQNATVVVEVEEYQGQVKNILRVPRIQR